MSVSASASVIMGFEICYSDFYTVTTKTNELPSCPKGHLPLRDEGKFCSECGGKFGKQSVEIVTANKGFASFCKKAKTTPHNALTKVEGDWKHLEELSEFPGALEVHMINNVEPNSQEQREYALGIKVLEQRGIIDGGNWNEPNVPNGTLVTTMINQFAPWLVIANEFWPDENRLPKLWLATSVG